MKAALVFGVILATVQTFAMGSLMTPKSFVKELGEDGSVRAISARGTRFSNKLVEDNLVPRGAALLTESGILKDQGIKYIIHAAPGGMDQGSDETKPTLDGVILSVQNSVGAAKRLSIKRVAIPFVGGGIFLDSLGIDKETLAKTIIQAAESAAGGIEVRFVAFGSEDTLIFTRAYDELKNSRKWYQKAYAAVTFNDFYTKSAVVSGDITKFQTHGSEAIVNAANMEVQFGGGLSGVIGRASGAAEQIDAAAAQMIKRYWAQ